MAVPHDDLLRDNSGAIIQRDREALVPADGGHELGQSSGVKHRVDRRQGQGGLKTIFLLLSQILHQTSFCVLMQEGAQGVSSGVGRSNAD